MRKREREREREEVVVNSERRSEALAGLVCCYRRW
jgi:hypothetical protein